MITEVRGNLLEAKVGALVNPVNAVGVMGKGLALQFKKAYPQMFSDYSASCRRGDVRVGKNGLPYVVGRLADNHEFSN